MAFPIPVGFAEIVYRHTYPTAAGEILCIWGLFDGGGDFVAVIDAAQAAWQDNVVPNLADLVTYVGCIYRRGTGGDPVTFERPPAPGSPTQGSVGSADALPLNTAVLARKLTAVGGRRNRGRCYTPPISISRTEDSNSLSAAGLAGFQAAFNQFRSALEAAGAEPVILHLSEGTEENPLGPLAPTTVTDISVVSRLATMRGRLRN